MNIGVVGTGYVGLVVGACLAENGNSVICVDNDETKVDSLKRGEIPIYEPGLAEMVPRNVAEDRLKFTTDLAAAVRASEVIFIAVGTPQDEDGSADLRHVLEVARGIGRAMNGFKVVVNKSTVPVGTAAKVRETIAALTKEPFAVVSNPEFLKEGVAVDDFLKPDRVVIGTDDPKVETLMRTLYEPFVRTGNPILVMDPASAELTKYAANAMLATRISFMNEIANYCDRVGADVRHVRLGMGSDSRIGSSFLFPGVGYGGSCFPKDVKAMLRMGQDAGTELGVVAAVEEANERQKRILVPRIAGHLGGLKGKTVAVWGLAFKPRTDDMREAPALVADRRAPRGRRGRSRLRPQGGGVGPAAAGRADHALREELRGGRGGGRAGRDHGVERVPRARLQADQEPDAPPRDLRRAQHLHPRPSFASWASTTRGSAGGEGARDGRRRATSAATPSASCGTPATPSSSSTTSRRDTAPPSFETSRSWRGTYGDAAVLRRALPGVDAVLHFAGILSVAESVRDPLRYHLHQHRQGPRPSRSRWRRRGCAG